MAKASTILKSREQEEAAKELRKQQEKLLRHRLLGALVIFLAAFFLWEIGGVLPPQQILREVPAAETLFPEEEFFAIKKSTREDIEENNVEDALEDVVENVEVVEEIIAKEMISEEEIAEAVIEDSMTMETETIETTEAETTTADVVVEEEISEEIPALTTEDTPTAEPATKATTDSEFVVQIGAFKERQRADTIMAKIKQRGLAAHQKNITRNGVELWRVRIGPYSTRVTAEKEQKVLVELGFPHTQILTLPANH
ncbi:MAG: SPOR domain-containing protein [Proteobacteria bacterium]|nr:SPOR domain-containing protein [Pseudomonadota bacterium]